MSGVDGPGGDVVGQAQSFAADLTEMLEGSVTYSASLRIEEISPSLEENEPPKGVIVEPTRSEECIPLATAADAEVGLFLRLSFTLQLDEEREHLAVQTSTFGLCIDERTGSCPIRVEYKRAKRHKRPAHVHVDGHAEGIAPRLRAHGAQTQDSRQATRPPRSPSLPPFGGGLPLVPR